MTLFAKMSNASSSLDGSRSTIRYWIPTCSINSICLDTSSGVPYITNSLICSSGVMTPEAQTTKAFSLDNLFLSLRINSQSLVVVKLDYLRVVGILIFAEVYYNTQYFYNKLK
jgi:hypothetical protein